MIRCTAQKQLSRPSGNRVPPQFVPALKRQAIITHPRAMVAAKELGFITVAYADAEDSLLLRQFNYVAVAQPKVGARIGRCGVAEIEHQLLYLPSLGIHPFDFHST